MLQLGIFFEAVQTLHGAKTEIVLTKVNSNKGDESIHGTWGLEQITDDNC